MLTSDTHTLSPARWDDFVGRHPHGHLLQSSVWGAFKSRFRWQAVQVALADGGRLVAGAQLLFRRLVGRLTLAYVPKGPLVDWEDEAQVERLLAAMEQVARRYGALGITIEPELPDDPAIARRLARFYFFPSDAIQPQSTLWLDLTGTPDDWLARMKQKTRYNIRLAAKRGVQVREGMEADLPAFYRLMEETAARDGFAPHAQEYYATGIRLLADGGMGCLLLAMYEGRVLGGVFVAACGPHAYYLWGASGNEGRHLMPNYLLQWEAMQWAARRGCRDYDLWGIPDEVGRNPAAFADTVTDRQGGLWGVYRFKQGFGGRVVRYAGAWDRAYHRFWYPLYQIALRVRKRRQQREQRAGA